MLQLCAISQESFTCSSALSVLYSVSEAGACETQDKKSPANPSLLHTNLLMCSSVCEIGCRVLHLLGSVYLACSLSKPQAKAVNIICAVFLAVSTWIFAFTKCTLTLGSFHRSLAPVQTSSQAIHDLAGLQAFAATGEDHTRR